MSIPKPSYTITALGSAASDTNNSGGHASRPTPSSSTTVSAVRGVASGNQSNTVVAHPNPAIPRQMSAGSNSPTSIRVKQMYGTNFSVDAATYQHLIDRRKSFRFRGSLGATVASAPSVEQEDYRTPRPSIPSIKIGKSFDFGGNNSRRGSLAYEKNGLILVSADYLRTVGSRQQFRNLLSAKKKLGQLPAAYTRINYSHESVESNPRFPNGPVITVEDTGNQVNVSLNRLSAASSALNSAQSSIDKVENGGVLNGGVHFPNTTKTPSRPPSACLRRNNSRYGVPVDESAVKMVYKQRSKRINTRVQIADRCLALAFIGIFFMILDNELCGQLIFGIDKNHPISLIFRTFVVASTGALLIEIVHYHWNEIMLDLIDCGADDWRVVLTLNRIIQFCTEFIICSICPFPGSSTMKWTIIEPPRLREKSKETEEVSTDILLSLLMIGRVYLIGRFMVLHSKQFQDASTRTLAALNRIQVNFSFVMKTALDQRPMLCLSIFTLVFWVASGWLFAQCERFGRDEDPFILYMNAFWFIAITAMQNGYGDIVPKTIFGRVIAIIVGVIGAIISSILIAVISRKMLLSPGQRNVNNFMNDSRLTQSHKHAAALVLQKTWHIYKSLQAPETPDHVLRQHQRKFLEAIHEFRRIKNKMRVFNESSSASIQQMNRLLTEMHTSMQRLVSSQEEMRAQIEPIIQGIHSCLRK
uniref:Calmodulin-binding domain-containing protein n=1 Tax=Acrobeloides nanus TaxID=290746 RepID=A0A914CE70_9BILA